MNEIPALRIESKKRMQGLINRALVLDEVSRARKNFLGNGRRSVLMAICLPITFLTVKALIYQGEMHGGHSYGITNFLLRHSISNRKMYRADLWEEDKRIRPYESLQFQDS